MGDLEVRKNGDQTGKALITPTVTDISAQRQAIQNIPGHSLKDSVERLQKIATGKIKERVRVEITPGVFKYRTVPVHVPVSSRVAAENSIESKMGWKAAEKLEITQHSLFMNLNDLSAEDLNALLTTKAQSV